MPKHYHTCLLMNALLALRPCLVSHQCRCVLQRLSVADFKRPCLKPLGVQLRASMPLYERSVGFASCKAFGRSTSGIHAPLRTLCWLCVLQSLWAFNFGHPCPPSKKGEVLLLGQAEPTMWGLLMP